MKTRTKAFGFIPPEMWLQPVEVAGLITSIKSIISDHVIVPKETLLPLALWVIHTYVFEHRDSVAYVAIESPEKRCGKTTLLSILAGLAARPLVASNITVGALFRAIDEFGPTLLIDEADTFLAGNGVMRGILNCGNSWRTAFVIRMQSDSGERDLSEQEKANPQIEANAIGGNLVQYDCYCPKVVAMIGETPETLADRSIVVHMTRKMVTEPCKPLTEFHPEPIQSMCVRFACDNQLAISEHMPVRLAGLNDRAADTYEPLAVLADMAGNDVLAELTECVRQLNGAVEMDLRGAGLLLDVLEIIINCKGEKVFSRDLAEHLSGEVDWSQATCFHGKAITEYQISKLLRNYGVRPHTMRIGPCVSKGYDAEDFKEVLRHYVPKEAIETRMAEMQRTAALRKEAKAEEEAELKKMLVKGGKQK